VSEPAADDDDEDCVEIGYAYVSLNEILHTGRDLVGNEVPSQQPSAFIHLLSILLSLLAGRLGWIEGTM